MHRQHIHALAVTVLALGATGSPVVAEAPGGFKPLFDGKTLQGWHALPGGSWQVADGLLVGRSAKAERRHGLLVSDRAYDDFVVRFQFRVVQGNSGFYFRSEKVPSAVGVHGFQAEVDRSDLIGGLYETGQRGWVRKPDPKARLRRKKVVAKAAMKTSSRGNSARYRLVGARRE